jgi:ankyrin repeat protein
MTKSRKRTVASVPTAAAAATTTTTATKLPSPRSTVTAAAAGTAVAPTKKYKIDPQWYPHTTAATSNTPPANVLLLDLRRLLHVMESSSSSSTTTTTNVSWQDLEMRGQLCQDMLQQYKTLVQPRLSSLSNGGGTPPNQMIQELQQRVNHAVQTTWTLVTKLRQEEEEEQHNSSSNGNGNGTTSRDPIEQIFGNLKPTQPSSSSSSSITMAVQDGSTLNGKSKNTPYDTTDDHHPTIPVPIRSSQTTTKTPPRTMERHSTNPKDPSLQQQQQQREQMELAVAEMAQQMKQRTLQLQEQLQDQNQQLLDNLQQSVTEQNDHVTQIAQQTQQHVRQSNSSWYRTMGTWTMLLMMVVTFVVVMMMIVVFPQPPLRNVHRVMTTSTTTSHPQDPSSSPPNSNLVCRMLPSGRQECFAADTADRMEEDHHHHRDRTTTTTTTDPVTTEHHHHSQEEEEEKDDIRTMAETDTVETPPIPSSFTYADAVYTAAYGDLEQLQLYLQEMPSLLQQHDSNGWTLLHESARNGHTHMVQYLIEVGHMNVYQTTETGHTALDVALYKLMDESHSTIVYLQRMMGLKNSILSDDSNNINSNKEDIVLPIQDDHTDQVHPADAAEFVVETPPIPSSITYTDAVYTAAYGDLEQLKLYVQEMPSLLQQQDPNGWTLLHESARNGHTHMVQYLIEVGHMNVYQTTHAGHTTLDVALYKLMDESHPTIVYLQQMMGLMNSIQSDENDQVNSEVKDDYVHQPMIASVPDDMGIQSTNTNMDAPTDVTNSGSVGGGEDGVMEQEENTHVGIVDSTMEPEVVEEAIQARVDIGVDHDDPDPPQEMERATTELDEKDDADEYPDAANEDHDSNVVEERNDEDADSDDGYEDEEMSTAFDSAKYATSMGDVDELRRHLDAHPDVVYDVDQNSGYTLLHVAAQYDNAMDCIQLLIDYGIDVWYGISNDDDLDSVNESTANTKTITALDVAISTHPENDQHPVILLLQEAMGFHSQFAHLDDGESAMENNHDDQDMESADVEEEEEEFDDEGTFMEDCEIDVHTGECVDLMDSVVSEHVPPIEQSPSNIVIPSLSSDELLAEALRDFDAMQQQQHP